MIVTVLTMTLSALNDVNPGDVVFVGLKRLLAMVALPVEIVVSAVYVSMASGCAGSEGWSAVG